jgi:hypothetical protein
MSRVKQKPFIPAEEKTDDFTVGLRHYYRNLKLTYMHELKLNALFRLRREGEKVYQLLGSTADGYWKFCDFNNGKRGAIHIEFLFYVLVYPC